MKQQRMRKVLHFIAGIITLFIWVWLTNLNGKFFLKEVIVSAGILSFVLFARIFIADRGVRRITKEA